MQYNVLHRGKRRPPKGLSILAKPCCFTCVKPRIKMGSRVATCGFVGGAIPEDVIWGYEQCPGFEPRPPEDFTLPGASAETAVGAKIAMPGEYTSAKKTARTRSVVIIVPPSEVALIVPPPRPTPRDSHRSGCDRGSGRASVDPDAEGNSVDDLPSGSTVRSLTDEEA